jgi:hypothetical protein
MPSVPQAFPPGLAPAGLVDDAVPHQAIPEKLTALPLGSVRPLGWLKQQLAENLDHFTGHLDELVPDLIVRDQIYGRDRLSPAVRHKDVGARGVPADQQVQFLWWNSETQSNWWDGFIRTAILTGRPEALRRARHQVDALLATQDADGYLGIYAPDLRYRFPGENGELWAKATALRYLLGWYEYSRDPAVLHAVVRAVDNLMQNYPVGQSHPFQSDRPDTSGLSHGLAITDVLESLYRHTGNAVYLDYLLFCYRDFSDQTLAEDAQLAKLLDRNLPLRGHGVHTYEHLRCVAAAAQGSGLPPLVRALDHFLQKIDLCLAASGGPVGDEWIDGSGACSTSRGYEYCSLQELLNSYTSLLLKSGRAEFGDRAERLFFNAAQGARLPDALGIAYLKSDNSYAMTGPLNSDPTTPAQNRYKYSPVHQDVAVCCVPNAGRIGPCYVQHMWAREASTLVACLLGPSELRTEIDGRPVHIVVETSYPYEQTLRFVITAPGLNLTLKVRRPAWVTQLPASDPWLERDGYLVFGLHLGPAPTILTVTFAPGVHRQHDPRGEVFYSLGALVLARAIPADESIAKTYPLPGYADRKFTAKQTAILLCPHDARIRPVPDQTLRFEAEFINSVTKAREWVFLEPMGTTILRQTTFPESEVPQSKPSPPR